MRLFLAAMAFLALATPSLGIAQTPDEVLRMCIGSDDQVMCEVSRKQMRSNIPKAWKGDYQAQRNVSYCLTYGCDGAVSVNKMLGCAWRVVVVSSGSTRVDKTDMMSLNTQCLSELSEAERNVALSQAETIFQKVYRKPIKFSGFDGIR